MLAGEIRALRGGLEEAQLRLHFPPPYPHHEVSSQKLTMVNLLPALSTCGSDHAACAEIDVFLFGCACAT